MNSSKNGFNGKKDKQATSSEKKSNRSHHEDNPTADPISSENQKRTRAAQQDEVTEHYEQLKDSAADILEDVRATLADAQESWKEYADELAENVKRNPLKSLLIAGGVGFILSSIFKK
ncbi:DUF883 family protein [Legionella jordanis]|uniref:DUF883 domain-containing protein n=1 Tax=Legionella jordanis TaxID=456 RepID=A0A0W0V8X7_9GAMM|nr:DUF883 family protein [Legionella jordanis]KTD16544.1 hypothetical protein Ljor_0850 [Legionella jordanis]RMX03916.1 DUF883 domain-containing protein [Legionella jordanis]RMX22018.1 DUF883 domain-containing protein [Legionella jordanis]VEH11994.1 Bacterial protein of uncharacterised function (DUF883) [Legionella jordanis]HAT8712702.1 DUF883 family protein [Legionella jordanis]